MKMKFRKKISFIVTTVTLLTTLLIFGLKGISTLQAGNEGYQLVISEESERSFSLSFQIAKPKNETLTLEYDGINHIGDEDVLEALTTVYGTDAFSVTSAPEKNKVTIKTKESSQPLSFRFYLNKETTEDKEGSIRLLADGEEKSSVAFHCVDQFRILAEEVKRLAGPSPEVKSENKTEADETSDEAPLLKSPVFTTFGTGDTVTVKSWDELKLALNDPSVGNIYVDEDLKATSDATAAVSLTPSEARDVTIIGKDNTIEFGSYRIQLPTNAEPGSHLEITDLNYTGENEYVVIGNDASNWMVTFDNVTAKTGTSKGLASVPKGSVKLRNTISLQNSAYNMVVAQQLSADGATITFETVGGHFVFSPEDLNVEFTDSSILGDTIKGYLASTIENVEAEGEVGGDLAFTFSNNTPSSLLHLSVENSEKGILFSKGRTTASITGADIWIGSHTDIGFALKGANSTLTVKDSKLFAKTTSQKSFIYAENTDVKVLFENSELEHSHVHDDKTDGTFFLSKNAAGSSLKLDNTPLKATSTGNFDFSSLSGKDTGGGSIIRTETSPGFNLEISGSKSVVELSSGISVTGGTESVISLGGEGVVFTVTKQAILNVSATQAGYACSAVVLQSIGATLTVSEKSELNLKSVGNYGLGSSTLRFHNSGNSSFNISGSSKISIDKSGTNTSSSLGYGDYTAPAVRMFGGHNKVFVGEGSDFIVNNRGAEGIIDSDGATISEGNQGILYTQTGGDIANLGNEFKVSGKDANVQVEAANGPAIQALSGTNAVGSLDFTAEKDTYFVVRGKTATEDAGAIQANTLTVNIDTPIYYDFANTRQGGGRAFANKDSSSTFISTKSEVSFWKRGSNLTGNPDYSSLLSDAQNATVYEKYSLSGTNYETLNAADSSPGVTAFLTGTNSGMPNMARITGNNQPAVVDELRTPTNADGYIWGHVGLPQGKYDEHRDAFTDEVYLRIQVTDTKNNSFETIATVVADENDKEGYFTLYGEEPRKGIWKAEIPAEFTDKFKGRYLAEGWQVEVLGAWRGKKENEGTALVHTSTADDIKTGTKTAIDVTPPDQASWTAGLDLSAPVSKLTGTATEEKDVVLSVFVKVNGSWLKDGSGDPVTTTVQNGKWEINLPNNLEKDDEIEIYLKDDTVLPEPFTEFALPDTYSSAPDGSPGNMNIVPAVYEANGGGYHDAIYVDKSPDYRFDPALTGKVEEGTGALTLDSAPTTIDFGSINYDATVARKDNPTRIGNLVVSDTRPAKTDWEVTAEVTKEMTSTTNSSSVLTGSLRYVKGGSEITLSDQAQVIHENTDGAASVDITSTWGATAADNGLKLEIDPTHVKSFGTYQGEILWKLSSTP